jgi:hypothetical protein
VGVELVFQHDWPTQALDAEASYHFQYATSQSDGAAKAAALEQAALTSWRTLPTEAQTPLVPDVADRFQRKFHLNGLLAETWYVFRAIAVGTSGSSLPSDPSKAVETKGMPPSCEPLLQIKRVSAEAVAMMVSFRPPEGRSPVNHIHMEQQTPLLYGHTESWSPSAIMVTRYVDASAILSCSFALSRAVLARASHVSVCLQTTYSSGCRRHERSSALSSLRSCRCVAKAWSALCIPNGAGKPTWYWRLG